MAYNDVDMTASNDAQRQRYAANPVIPNASPQMDTTPVSSAPAARDPDGFGETPVTNASADSGYGSAMGHIAGAVGDAIRGGMNVFESAGPFPVTVSPTTANPRPAVEQASAKESPGLDPSTTYSQQAPGPITAATRALDVTAAPSGIAGTNAQSAAFDQAQGRQDLADRSQAAARVAAAPSSRDIERMQGEARVDKWQLENAKMDAQGHIGRNPRSAIAAASKIADQSAADLNTARAQNQAAATNPLRSPVQEEIAKQQSLVAGQGANTQTALAGQALQKGQFELKHQALIQGLADKLGTTDQNSPEYGRLLSSYRALNGLGSAWKTQVVAGETYANPDNPAGPPLQRGGRVVSTNELTGETHEVPLGQQQKATPQYEKGKSYTDAKGNKATWDGTKFVPAS